MLHNYLHIRRQASILNYRLTKDKMRGKLKTLHLRNRGEKMTKFR